MFLQVQHTALQRPVQSSENQLETKKKEEEEEGGGTVFGKQERLRDGERKLAGSRIWQELGGDWFVGFVQPPEAGEPFGREGSSPGGTD